MRKTQYLSGTIPETHRSFYLFDNLTFVLIIYFYKSFQKNNDSNNEVFVVHPIMVPKTWFLEDDHSFFYGLSFGMLSSRYSLSWVLVRTVYPPGVIYV